MINHTFYNIKLRKLYFNSLKYNTLFIIFLFIGFITSGIFTYYIPILRYFAVIAIFIYLLFNMLINYWVEKKLFLFQLFLVSYILLQYLLNQTRDFGGDYSSLIAMLLASIFYKKIDSIINIIKFIIVVNFFIMLYEVISLEYIIKIVESNEYVSARMQGLFSYSKEAGYFLLIVFIFLRYFSVSMFYKILILLSSVMSGSRTAILAVCFILILDYIVSTHKKLTVINLVKQYVYLIMTSGMLIIFSIYYFSSKNEYMFRRILSSFNFDSSNHLERFYFWNSYFNGLNDYTLFEWIFGKGTYLNHLIGNGAENTYLMIISQIGIIGLLLFIIPIFLIILLFLKFSFKYYPLMILFTFLFVGRVGTGWADGILMWILIFYILNNSYTYMSKINRFKNISNCKQNLT